MRLTPLAEALDAARYGGKAAGLARLLGWGFDVPEGVALAEGDVAEPDAVPFAAPWAVRSSAVGEDGARASFAGLHRTVLGVNPEGLAAAVDAVRASGHSEAAVAYRAGMGIGGPVRMGVVVQRMVAAERSFVAFGAHPVTSADVVVIEGVEGGGEPLVAGEINPERFFVDAGGRLVRREPGDAPFAAADPEVLAVAALVRAIGARAGRPQDVELAVAAGRIRVLQARPISSGRWR